VFELLLLFVELCESECACAIVYKVRDQLHVSILGAKESKLGPETLAKLG